MAMRVGQKGRCVLGKSLKARNLMCIERTSNAHASLYKESPNKPLHFIDKLTSLIYKPVSLVDDLTSL
jgi:hypothetical protein